MVKTSDLLKDALALIIDPAHWTKNVLGRDKNGEKVQYYNAVCFCATGSIYRAAYQGSGFNASNDALDRLASTIRIRQGILSEKPDLSVITQFNDHPDTTHADVIHMFKMTIKQEELRESRLL